MNGKTELRHLLLALLLSIVVASTAWTQDAETDETDEADDANVAAEPAEVTEADADEEAIDVDDGSYLDAEDDDFKPSEEISADRSITFPTDI